MTGPVARRGAGAALVGVLALSGCGGGAHHHLATGPTSTTTSTTASTTTAPQAVTTSTMPSTGPSGGPVPRGFQPESVTFVSGQTGWVLGLAPCSAGQCPTILRTHDGGSSWASIPAPPASIGTAPSDVDEIRFADATDGWVYGSGVVFSTHDGGAHWSPVGAPLAGNSLASMEAAGGYAYALVISGSGASPAPASVYRSAVTADSWVRQPGTTVDQAVSGRLVVHDSDAWVAVQTDGGPTAFRAQVGGSWVSRSLPCQRSGGEVLAAASGSSLSVICASGAAAGSQPKLPYVSADGGASWRPGAQAPIAGDTLSSAMASPSTIVVAAASGASWLYASFDGGQRWSTVEQDTAGGGQPWRDLGFTDSTQGVVIEGNAGAGGSGMPVPVLYFTRDGGHSWHPSRFG